MSKKSISPSQASSNGTGVSVNTHSYVDELASSSGSRESTPPLLEDDNSNSTPAPVGTPEPLTTIQIQRLQVYHVLRNDHPTMARQDVIDLATAEEKKNPEDEWYEKKFNTDPKARKDLPSNLEEVKQSLKNHEITPCTAQMALQASLARKLAEKRRREQQKRKALYDADNENVENDYPSVPDADEVDDEKSNDSGPDSEEPEENDVVIKDDDEKSKCDFIDYEADESDAGDEDEDTITKENEDEDAVTEENKETNNTLRSGNFEFSDEKNNEAADKNDAEFVPETPEKASSMPLFDAWLDSGFPPSSSQSTREDENRMQTRYEEEEEGQVIDIEDILYKNESNRSPTRLAEELLEDLAGDCSGIFEYSEDNQYCHGYICWVPPEDFVGVSDDEEEEVDYDEDDQIEKEAMELRRDMRSYRRLMFSDYDDESDDDEKDEGQQDEEEEQEKEENVLRSLDTQSSELHSMEVPKINSPSGQKGENNADGSNGRSDRKETITNDEGSKSRSLFSDDDDEHGDDAPGAAIDKDEVRSDDEDEQDEKEEEVNSSDDELEICRRLKSAQKPKKSEYIDEEASLSGDDVGSDENDDDDQLDVYEAEEGDNDDVPDEETIKEQLHKQWMKQQQDEENKNLLFWKNQLLMDGDLTGETDRTFRFKLREDSKESTSEKVHNTSEGEENDETDDEEIEKRRKEMRKWKNEEKKARSGGDNSAQLKLNPLLSAALGVINKGSSNKSGQSQRKTESPAARNSLLNHRRSLSQLVGQTDIRMYATSIVPNSSHANEGRSQTQNALKRSAEGTASSGKKKIRRK